MREGLVAVEQVARLDADLGLAASEELPAQRGVPHDVVLGLVGQPRVVDVVERRAQGEPLPEGPAQLYGGQMVRVVALRGAGLRVEQAVDRRRVGEREVEVVADVAADDDLGNEDQLAHRAPHAVQQHRNVGVVGREADVDVAADPVHGESFDEASESHNSSVMCIYHCMYIVTGKDFGI